MDLRELRDAVTAMMPEVQADLERLVRIPSVSLPGFLPEPLREMANAVVELITSAVPGNVRLRASRPARTDPAIQSGEARHARCIWQGQRAHGTGGIDPAHQQHGRRRPPGGDHPVGRRGYCGGHPFRRLPYIRDMDFEGELPAWLQEDLEEL
jgi:hypothetical protein